MYCNGSSGVVLAFATPPVPASNTLLACFSDTLELKATKESAHNGFVYSVAFSPDGSKIVSGSDDKTIKVWDAVNFRPHVESEWEKFEKTVDAEDSDEEDEIETWWRNKITGHEQSVKPSGSMCLPMNPGRSKCGTQVSRFTFRHLFCPRL